MNAQLKPNLKPQTTSKIQKVLADCGVASRREIERWIKARRILVNGCIAEIGDRVSATDQLTVDGKLIRRNTQTKQTRFILYHKPEGEVCTRSDEHNRPTVFASLPKLKTGRWVSIGRLDLNTSGLLLFTNEGQLAHQLMHPSYSHVREYTVRVFGRVTDDMIHQLLQGVTLDDQASAFKTIHSLRGEGRNRWFRVTLTEGRNRIVRRLWESQGLTVSRLIRTRFADFKLPRSLKPGQWQELNIP